MEIAANIKTAPIQSASHDAYASGKGPVPVHRRRHYFLPGCCACFPSFLLHRGRVIALARSPIATRAVIQSLLCGRYVAFLALPNLQGRLLDGARKREGDCPGKPRFESQIHILSWKDQTRGSNRQGAFSALVLAADAAEARSSPSFSQLICNSSVRSRTASPRAAPK